MAFPFEPFRIKVVEPIAMTTRQERVEALEKAGNNVFMIPSQKVLIDMLTDSGTSAMSDNQWAGIMLGDEAYAQCRNWQNLESTVKDIFGYKHVIPVHQGRAGENFLFENLLKEKKIVISNTHFDTTRAQVWHHHGKPMDMVIEEGKDPSLEHPFKGNVDVEKARAYIKEQGPEKIAFGFLTLTNNSGGGQPVSMQNIKEFSNMLNEYDIPLFFDIARYAENCYFIKSREKGYEDKTINEIARETFSHGVGAWMSSKKDALVNIGGFITLEDDELARNVTNTVILNEGFATYGGLAGRDLEALSRGLVEGLDENYLGYRIGQVEEMGRQLIQAGVPILRPTGGHAVYLDARKLAAHLPQEQFPAISLTNALYREFGIRGVEIGSLMFAAPDPNTGEVSYPAMELVRLCIPRRVYTGSHLQYVTDSIIDITKNADKLNGYEIEYQAPTLRHFTARLKEVR
jgi:tryptophanase